MQPQKRLALTEALHGESGETVQGYEIHMGETSDPDCARPLFTVAGLPEGAVSENGRIMGSYMHGMFSADGFRRAFLTRLGAQTGDFNYDATVDAVLDRLADHLEAHVDCDGLLALARAGV